MESSHINGWGMRTMFTDIQEGTDAVKCVYV